MNRKSLFNSSFLQEFLMLEETNSTNSFLKDYLSNNTPKGNILVSTNHQTAGKGQNGSSWFSDANKNATLSIGFVDLDALAPEIFYFNKTIALATRATLSQFCSTAATIKWPNDIYVGQKKIGGILIENIIGPAGKIKQIIAGIGININQEAFPKDIPNPTSVYIEESKTVALNDLIEVLIENVKAYKELFDHKDFEKIDSLYHEFLYQKGESKNYLDIKNGLVFEGRIQRVNASGSLEIIKNDDWLTYDVKEIKFL